MSENQEHKPKSGLYRPPYLREEIIEGKKRYLSQRVGKIMDLDKPVGDVIFDGTVLFFQLYHKTVTYGFAVNIHTLETWGGCVPEEIRK